MATSVIASSRSNSSYTSLAAASKLIFLALIFLVDIETSVAIQCYKCAVTLEKHNIKNQTVYTHMCSKFDESDKYVIDCPFSTMCLKTISTLHLQNGPSETITRGCAAQKDTTQVFRNRQWQQEHSVQEVYEEGCYELKEHLGGTVKTHCYCRGELCNSAMRSTSFMMLHLTALSVILIYASSLWSAIRGRYV